MEMFTPSLDWGNEIVASLLWVAKAWAISAVVMVAVLTCSPGSPRGAGSSGGSPAAISLGDRAFRCGRCSGVLLLSVIIDVRIDVLFSYHEQ